MTKDKKLNPLQLFIWSDWVLLQGNTRHVSFIRFCEIPNTLTRRDFQINTQSKKIELGKAECKPRQSGERLRVSAGADATHKLLKARSKLETCGRKQQTLLEHLLCQIDNRRAAGVCFFCFFYSSTKQTHVVLIKKLSSFQSKVNGNSVNEYKYIEGLLLKEYRP